MNVIVLGQLLMDTLKAQNRSPILSGPVSFGLILIEIVGGIAAIWTYAAIRPRFGPGARTATYAGLLGWVFVCLPVTANGIQANLGPGRFWLYSMLIGVVSSLVSTIAGAALYKEEATAAYPAATPQATH